MTLSGTGSVVVVGIVEVAGTAGRVLVVDDDVAVVGATTADAVVDASCP